MSEIHFTEIKMFFLLWLLPVMALLFLYAAERRRKALASFISPRAAGKFIHISGAPKRLGRFVLLAAAVCFLIITLARPAWNLKETTVKRSGRDVVFLLDVSRSMLATDLKPNRLERAKIAIRDCVEKLRGDRVALVAFAGSAAVKCPLTQDYAFFLMTLEAVDIDSVRRGGTMLGDALRTIEKEVFDDQKKQYKDIVLITDGEDHDSFPVQAAQTAGTAGIRLIIVGLGDEGEGQRIPIEDKQGNNTFLKYEGKEVWTRLDGETLRRMARATPGGRYLPVATGTIDLGQVYLDLIASADQKKLATETIRKYEEKFQIFLAAALVLLFMEAAWGQPLLPLLLLVIMAGLPAPPASARSSADLIAAGNRAYEGGHFSEAIQVYSKAAENEESRALALYNQGNSLYRLGKFEEARKAYSEAIQEDPGEGLAARSWFNRGNAAYQLAVSSRNPADRLAAFKQSAADYEQALQKEPDLTGAGRNLEIARRKIKELEQELQQNESGQQDPREGQGQNGENEEKEAGEEGDGGQQQKEDQPPRDQQNESESTDGARPEKENREQQSPGQPQPSDRPEPSEQEGLQEDGKTAMPPLELSEQAIEDILNAEKKLHRLRRQRMGTAPLTVDKDW